MATILSGSEIIERGREIYYAQVRPNLSETDRGKFVEINVDTGEWVIEDDDAVASLRAREKFGSAASRYVHRAGYRVPYTLGYALVAVEELI